MAAVCAPPRSRCDASSAIHFLSRLGRGSEDAGTPSAEAERAVGGAPRCCCFLGRANDMNESSEPFVR